MHRDAFFMRQALRLAERGRATTSPNPMVGALVVDPEGVIVGRGAHQAAGAPHAEVHALRDAGARARGATLYCTLEPCTHVGRTAACAPVVAAAGISRVVVASEDPNPVAAGGVSFLRGRGIDVTTGVLETEARRLNAPFLTRVTRGRPFVTMKVAMSLDGKIAAAPGQRTTLTGAAANRLVHRERAEIDAIAIGRGTLLADDPVLTARGAFRARPLIRIVYARQLDVPSSARLFSTLNIGPVIIVCTARALGENERRAGVLRAAGVEILSTAGADVLGESLTTLASRGVSSMMVEGGAELHRAFWEAALVDRVQIYVTQQVLGAGGVPWIPESVMSSIRMVCRTARPVGDDTLLEGYVHGAD